MNDYPEYLEDPVMKRPRNFIKEKPSITTGVSYQGPPSRISQLPENKRTKFYEQIVEQAKRQHDAWVVISGFRSSGTATQMRNGGYIAINPDDFIIKSTKNPETGRYDIYLKYIGEETADNEH